MTSQHCFSIVLLSRKYCNHLSEEEKAKKKNRVNKMFLLEVHLNLSRGKGKSLHLFSYLCMLFVERQFKWPTKENMYAIWLLKNYGRVNGGKPHFALQVDIRIMNRCHVETIRRHTCTNYRTRQIRFLCPSNSNTNDKHFTLGTKWRGGKNPNPCLLDRELSHTPPPPIRHRNNTDKHRHTLG